MFWYGRISYIVLVFKPINITINPINVTSNVSFYAKPS